MFSRRDQDSGALVCLFGRTVDQRLPLISGAFALAFAAMASVPVAASSETDWTLRREDPEADIQVFQRINSTGYAEFRGVTRVKSSLNGFIALFGDVRVMDQWMYRTKEVQRIEVVSPQELYAYTRSNLPWPLLDRDVVLHISISQDPESYVVRITADSVPGRLPVVDGVVRMPLVRSRWTLTPLADGQIEVAFEGYGDPGGSLSTLFSWFYKIALSEAPFKTLEELRQLISEPRYQEVPPEVVKEAPPRVGAAEPDKLRTWAGSGSRPKARSGGAIDR